MSRRKFIRGAVIAALPALTVGCQAASELPPPTVARETFVAPSADDPPVETTRVPSQAALMAVAPGETTPFTWAQAALDVQAVFETHARAIETLLLERDAPEAMRKAAVAEIERLMNAHVQRVRDMRLQFPAE